MVDNLFTKNSKLGSLKTIDKVASELNIEQHVLRFWETKFPQIKPLKGNGNRRLYSMRDIEYIIKIKDLLHNQGYTIEGAKKFLQSGKNTISSNNIGDKHHINEIIDELQSIKNTINQLLVNEGLDNSLKE